MKYVSNKITAGVRLMDHLLPKDGRWYLGGSHLLLCLISILFYNFQRSILQILLGYIAALITEFLFFKFSDKYKGRSLADRMFSAATEAAGLIILVKSGHLFYYAIASSMAVSSKYIFRIDEKNHLYNPTNFAIVTGLCFFPQGSFNLLPDEFTLSLYPIIHVTLFGLLAIWRGGTWPVTLGYVATLFAFSLGGSLFFKQSFFYWFMPEIGAAGLIYIFLMITDPRTTPKSWQSMLVFGITVALLKILLKYNQILYPNYIALFTVTLVRGLYLLIPIRNHNWPKKRFKLTMEK